MSISSETTLRRTLVYIDSVISVLVLAGNKADLEAQRQVTKEAAQALADEVRAFLARLKSIRC